MYIVCQMSSSTSPPGPGETSTSRSSADIGGFRCEICSTPFPSSNELDRHKDQAHKLWTARITRFFPISIFVHAKILLLPAKAKASNGCICAYNSKYLWHITVWKKVNFLFIVCSWMSQILMKLSLSHYPYTDMHKQWQETIGK